MSLCKYCLRRLSYRRRSFTTRANSPPPEGRAILVSGVPSKYGTVNNFGGSSFLSECGNAAQYLICRVGSPISRPRCKTINSPLRPKPCSGVWIGPAVLGVVTLALLGFGGSVSRDAHQSPIGIKACTPLLDGAGAPPLAPVVPQKTVGAAPRPEVMITDLMASLSGPTLRWLAARAQRSRQPLTRAVMTVSGRRPNQIWWLQANPKLGLAVPPFTRSSAPNRTEPCRASHGSMPGPAYAPPP